MKRKTDDLERLDGSFPFWMKALITIVSAVIAFVVFYFLMRYVHF